MTRPLYWLGRACARRHWVVIGIRVAAREHALAGRKDDR
jgi:hypothetical protein